MTAVLEAVPVSVQVKVLRSVAAAKFPRLALPSIASTYNLTLDQVQTIANHHGYPDTDALAKAARRLEAQLAARQEELRALAQEQAHEQETSEDDQPTSETAPATAPRGDEPPVTEQLLTIPVADLHPDPDNPRENLTGIDELAESIQSVGLLQPIVARRHKGRFIVVAGHRRLAAVKRLGHEEVNVVVRSHMRPDDVLAAMLIENGQRADLDPIEEARGLRRLKTQLDCNDTELGTRIGRSMAYVNGRLLLLNLSAEEQQAIRDGNLGVTAGTQKARMNSGRVRPNSVGRPAVGHLSATHELADRVRARCTRAGHSKGKGTGVGGVGCGLCWESVIRADEREHLHTVSAKRGECQICGHALEAAVGP